MLAMTPLNAGASSDQVAAEHTRFLGGGIRLCGAIYKLKIEAGLNGPPEIALARACPGGSRGPALDSVPARLFPLRSGALAPLSAPVPGKADRRLPRRRLEFFADQAVLAEPAAFNAHLAALRKHEWVVYAGIDAVGVLLDVAGPTSQTRFRDLARKAIGAATQDHRRQPLHEAVADCPGREGSSARVGLDVGSGEPCARNFFLCEPGTEDAARA